MNIQPYLTFTGNCEEAFRVYAEVLGGTVETTHRYGGSPMAAQAPEGWADKVMHTALRIGDEMLLGCDAPPPHYSKPQGLRICLQFQQGAEAEPVYQKLSEGGEITMPFQETFWAERFAMFVDRFGTPWMINVSKPM